MRKNKIYILTLLLAFTVPGLAQEGSDQKLFEVYGFVMTDAGYNFNQIHPTGMMWSVRPSCLPMKVNMDRTGTLTSVYGKPVLVLKVICPHLWESSKRSSNLSFLGPGWMLGRPHSG